MIRLARMHRPFVIALVVLVALVACKGKGKPKQEPGDDEPHNPKSGRR